MNIPAASPNTPNPTYPFAGETGLLNREPYRRRRYSVLGYRRAGVGPQGRLSGAFLAARQSPRTGGQFRGGDCRAGSAAAGPASGRFGQRPKILAGGAVRHGYLAHPALSVGRHPSPRTATALRLSPAQRLGLCSQRQTGAFRRIPHVGRLSHGGGGTLPVACRAR